MGCTHLELVRVPDAKLADSAVVLLERLASPLAGKVKADDLGVAECAFEIYRFSMRVYEAETAEEGVWVLVLFWRRELFAVRAWLEGGLECATGRRGGR